LWARGSPISVTVKVLARSVDLASTIGSLSGGTVEGKAAAAGGDVERALTVDRQRRCGETHPERQVCSRRALARPLVEGAHVDRLAEGLSPVGGHGHERRPVGAQTTREGCGLGVAGPPSDVDDVLAGGFGIHGKGSDGAVILGLRAGLAPGVSDH